MAKEDRVVPVKNYIYLSLIMLVSVFLVYYFFLWNKTYQESKINTAIMDKYLTVINYSELDSYLLENENTIVYVSVVGDESIRNFEKKFKNTIVKNSFSNMLYMDISNEFASNLSLKYEINSNKIPCILVFEGDKLIDYYYIDVNNYNLKKIRKYLVALGVNDEY